MSTVFGLKHIPSG